MKNSYYLILIFSVFWGCKNSQPTESVNPPVGKEICFSGYVFSNESNSVISDLIVTLEGDSLFFDTTNADGQFHFFLNTEGEYELVINDSMFHPFDSLLTISQDTSIVISLTPILCDYFPLNIGNTWTYAYKLRDVCSGDNIYIDGTEVWEITDLKKSLNGLKSYKCQRNFNGIKIDARGPYSPDTSVINISDEFTIVEDEEHNLQIKHPSFKPGIILPRYYTVNYPEEIVYESLAELWYHYKKQIGLTFWEEFKGSGHCNTTTTWTLSNYNINE